VSNFIYLKDAESDKKFQKFFKVCKFVINLTKILKLTGKLFVKEKFEKSI